MTPFSKIVRAFAESPGIPYDILQGKDFGLIALHRRTACFSQMPPFSFACHT